MTVQYSVGKSNCLTEVPNNVKLRLDDGILTLEKGSKVYIPNGYDINTNIIGSPTIVNGVVSGFSDVNFLKLDKPFNPESNYFEIQFKFITDTLTTDVEQYIFSSIQDETTDGRIGFRIYYRGDKLMLSEASLDGKSWVYANTGTTSLISNTTYYVKVIRDNATTSLYLRTEDTDWILECQMSQVSSTVFKYSYIGQWRGSTGYSSTTKCSVDLSQSYIKINDEMFWQGRDGNGKPVFKEHTIQNDITADTSTYTGFYCYGFGDYGDWLTVLTSGVSSATIPTTSGLMGWYDMTANRIKRWHGTSSTWQDNDFSLPLCYCTSSDGKLVINQIFNDFSYIGGQTFALPGVKGLIPNGWNEDGTYKTVEFEIDEVIRGNVEFNNNVANYGVINLENNGNLTLCRSAKSLTSYNEETNLIYRSDGLFPNSTVAFETQSSSNTISAFVPTQVKTTNDSRNMQIKYGVGKTNCLTSVPHNINLELVDGILTLKAGSKVYVPNGFEADGTTKKFDEVVIENDIVNTTSGANECLICVNGTHLYAGFTTGGTVSERPSSPITHAMYYNTTTNKCEVYYNSTWNEFSLPIAKVTRGADGFTSINQIFDWCGYIGSTIFVLPGVKSFVSDGWNEDGTYKNLNGITNNVIIRSNPNVGAKNICLYYDENGSASSIGFGIYDDTISMLSERESSWTSGHYVYVKDENKRYVNLNTTSSYLVVVTDMIVDSSTSKITSMTPYEVKTTNDIIDIKEVHQCVGKTNCLTEVPQDINWELDPLNVTVVGTPTINNGIVSGFSTSNYLTLPEIFQPVDNNWELLIKYTPTATPSDWASLIGCGDSLDWTSGVHIYHYSDGKLGLECTSTNGSWDIVRQKGQTVLTLGTTYWVKAIYNKINYSLYLSTNGIDWNQEVSVDSTTPIHASVIQTLGINVGFSKTIIGSIDLSESYIKINDEIWWKGGTDIFTLKKGSKVYTGTNESYITETDLSYGLHFPNADVADCYAMVTKTINDIENHQILVISPSDTKLNYTDNKLIYQNTSSETNPKYECYLPFALVSRNKTKSSSVNQIFNGLGYIGNRYFMTTGVKCLEPNGWNEDGTYKVNERQSTNVYVSAEQTGDVTNRAICLTYSNDKLLPEWKDNYQTIQSKDLILAGDNYYIIDENKIYSRYKGLYCTTTKVGSYQVTSGKITNFNVDNIKTTNDTKIIYKSDEINFSPEIDSW